MTSWKLTLPCTRAEAEAIDAADDLGLDPPPTLMTTEEVVDDAERWRLDAYFERAPDAGAIAAVAALVPSAAGTDPMVEPIADQDWVTLSQAGLEPLAVGRFFVHTGVHDPVPPDRAGARAFLIEAGQAFGTGHHETTAGCLAMLDAMADHHVANVIDLGTGTGLLAFAARHLWPAADVTATDIDPIAIDVTRENMGVNAVDRVRLIVADGAQDPDIARHARYDLVIANILAGPLIAMAPEIAAIAAPGATILLAGLLTTQFPAVRDAYAVHGAGVTATDVRGDWTIVRLTAASHPIAPPGEMATGDRDAWATDS